eukprot:3427606-Prymnesium_polylepis.1
MVPSLWVACPALCARYRSYELSYVTGPRPSAELGGRAGKEAPRRSRARAELAAVRIGSRGHKSA